MLDKEINQLRSSPDAVKDYLSGMSLLQRSGVLNYLRAFGRSYLGLKDTTESIALSGAYNAGFQDCLDLLINFEELRLRPKPNQQQIEPTYGGMKEALTKKYITKEEYDAHVSKSA